MISARRRLGRGTMVNMTVASLVVSIVALMAAVASAWFTHAQARAAQHAVTIERERAHDERKPKFAVTFRPLNPGQPVYHQLRVRLMSSTPASIPAIVLLEPRSGVKFTPGIEGVDPGDPSPVKAGFHHQPIDVGAEAVWQLEVEDDAASDLMVRITSKIGDETWDAVETASNSGADSRA